MAEGRCIHGDFYPDPTDCHKFTRCVLGRFYYFTCPSGLVFNPRTTGCEGESRSFQCQTTPQIPSTTTTTTVTQPFIHRSTTTRKFVTRRGRIPTSRRTTEIITQKSTSTFTTPRNVIGNITPTRTRTVPRARPFTTIPPTFPGYTERLENTPRVRIHKPITTPEILGSALPGLIVSAFLLIFLLLFLKKDTIKKKWKKYKGSTITRRRDEQQNNNVHNKTLPDPSMHIYETAEESQQNKEKPVPSPRHIAANGTVRCKYQLPSYYPQIHVNGNDTQQNVYTVDTTMPRNQKDNMHSPVYNGIPDNFVVQGIAVPPSSHPSDDNHYSDDSFSSYDDSEFDDTDDDFEYNVTQSQEHLPATQTNSGVMTNNTLYRPSSSEELSAQNNDSEECYSEIGNPSVVYDDVPR